jgi:hypothetical protein
MDETTPKPADTDPCLTVHRQCLVGFIYLSQATSLYIFGKD